METPNNITLNSHKNSKKKRKTLSDKNNVALEELNTNKYHVQMLGKSITNRTFGKIYYK